jgi:hypothetical protein
MLTLHISLIFFGLIFYSKIFKYYLLFYILFFSGKNLMQKLWRKVGVLILGQNNHDAVSNKNVVFAFFPFHRRGCCRCCNQRLCLLRHQLLLSTLSARFKYWVTCSGCRTIGANSTQPWRIVVYKGGRTRLLLFIFLNCSIE